MDEDKQYIGQIRITALPFAPVGWAVCDGSFLRVADHRQLFELIGTTYGGDGLETFALPDLRGRSAIHFGTGSGLSPQALGETAGTEEVTLSPAELGKHTHAPRASNGAGDSDDAGGNFWSKSSRTTQFGEAATADTTMSANAVGTAGKNKAHDNMMPFLAVNFIIALGGASPHN